MGAWSYVDRKIETILRAIRNGCEWPHCVSRPANASTAIGTTDEHMADQSRLVAAAVGPAESDDDQINVANQDMKSKLNRRK